MKPLVVLISVAVVARAVGVLWSPLRAWPAAVAVGLAAMFLLTAATHFQPRSRGLMIAMVPPRLPRPDLLVTITGVLEMLGAVGLLVPSTRSLAAGALGLLVLAMTPANVHGETLRHQGAPLTPLRPRMAIQVVFLAACGWVALAS